MHRVLAANADLEHIRKLAQILSGEGTDMDSRFSSSAISTFKYAPVTSVDVERSFSALKYILNERSQGQVDRKSEKMLTLACDLFFFMDDIKPCRIP
jgi:hypothetical protein